MKTRFDGFPLIAACDKLSHRCSNLNGYPLSSSSLWSELVRYFEKETSAVSVTIEVHFNNVGKGTAEIGRDGSLVCRLDN